MNKLDQQIVNRILKVLNKSSPDLKHQVTIGTLSHNPVFHTISAHGSASVQLQPMINTYMSWINNPSSAINPVVGDLGLSKNQIQELQKDFLTNGW